MRAFTYNHKSNRSAVAAWLTMTAALLVLVLTAILAEPYHIEADMTGRTLADLETQPLFWAALALAASLLMAILLKKLLLPLLMIKEEEPAAEKEDKRS